MAAPAPGKKTHDSTLAEVRLMSADDKLDELLALQRRLVAAAPAWAAGNRLGPEVMETRHAALRVCHERYAALVPAYREVADSLGASGPVSLEVVVNGLMFSGLFKSYDPERLRAGDFAAMTGWLGRVSTGVPPVETSGVTRIAEWRARLRAQGIFLSFSSGTSGRLSFVPRNLLTLRALAGNGASYADPKLPLSGFDCLVLGPRGDGIGLLDAGNGLARSAPRSHFLFDRPLTADAVQAQGTGGGAGWLEAGDVDAAYAAAFAFIGDATRDGHPVLVFGPPFQVRRLGERIASASSQGRLPTAPGSVLVTGGGWKALNGERLPRAELLRLVNDTLGIPPERCIDSYSTSELNAAVSTCGHGRYHVPPLLEAVVLDEALTGELGRPGEGLLGFLDPFAASYPGFVITDDRATLAFGTCGCGRSGAFIEGEIERAPGAEVRGCGGVLGSILA
jgi:hypothetical protein